MKFSIVVCTRNRPLKLRLCLSSILSNSFEDFEIVIINQSESQFLLTKRDDIDDRRIKHVYSPDIGLSKGRNKGIKESNGEIIVFTDDDCIVYKDWLENIYQSFERNKYIIAVFGKVLPYKPYLHKGKICPCVFINNKKRIITKPCLHRKNIGFGNNMAFKREVFDKVGYFKEWLGVNSIGKSAEDAEFALRTLIRGYVILYNPKVVVYHNRWLTSQEYPKQDLAYICGEMACYGHFFFKGFGFARKVVINNFKDSCLDLRKTLKSLVFLQKNFLNNFMYFAKKLLSRLKGLIVGFYFTKLSEE